MQESCCISCSCTMQRCSSAGSPGRSSKVKHDTRHLAALSAGKREQSTFRSWWSYDQLGQGSGWRTLACARTVPPFGAELGLQLELLRGDAARCQDLRHTDEVDITGDKETWKRSIALLVLVIRGHVRSVPPGGRAGSRRVCPSQLAAEGEALAKSMLSQSCTQRLATLLNARCA